MKRLAIFTGRTLRTMWGVLLAAVLIALAFLHVVGFPDFLQRFVVKQIARAGLAAQFGAIHLDLSRGIIASDAVLADAKDPTRPLARVDEVQLQWNWLWPLQRQQSLIRAIRITNATIAVPTPPDETGPADFTAKNASATLRFDTDGTIDLDRLSGEYCGIRVVMAGRVKPRVSPLPPLPPGVTRKSPFFFITKVVRELNRIKVGAPPELTVDFAVDLENPLTATAQAKLHGVGLQDRGLKVDSAVVEVAMQNGAIILQQVRLQLYGGELALHGRYDLGQGQFDLRLTSTVDPVTLAQILLPDTARLIAQVHLQKNPRVTAHYFLSPETGTLPVLEGTVECAGLEYRSVKFEAIKFAFENQGPEIKFTNALIAMAEGKLTGHGQYHLESSDFLYSLDSTLDPTKLLPLMTPVMKQIVEPSRFTSPPHVTAAVSGDFVDPDALAYDAQVTAVNCAYRGVPMRFASGSLRLRHSVLDTKDLVLERADGAVRGRIVADFNTHRTSFDLTTTANPYAMAALLGPKASEIIAPYQFGTPTTGRGRGVVDFDDARGTDWTAQLVTENPVYRGVPLRRAATTLEFRGNQLGVRNLTLTSGSGETRGDLLVDFNDQHVTFDLATTANPWELAPLIGDQAFDALQPYRFGPRTAAHASGFVDLTGREQPSWSAHVTNEGFGWWKLRANCAEGDIAAFSGTVRAVFAADGITGDTLSAVTTQGSLVWSNNTTTAHVSGTGVSCLKLVADSAVSDLVYSNNTIHAQLDVDGLQWWKLKADAARANVVYEDNTLSFENISATLYGGDLRGRAELVSDESEPTSFWMELSAADCDLQRLTTVTRSGHEITGMLSGRVSLEGEGLDTNTLRGKGSLNIANGVLWQAPLFWIFSKTLGNTKATAAKGTFTIANGALKTEDLDVAAGALSIRANGKVTLDGGLDFRVEGQFLRSWIGINFITWPLSKVLQYKVGGTIAKPSYRALNLPKELLPHED